MTVLLHMTAGGNVRREGHPVTVVLQPMERTLWRALVMANHRYVTCDAIMSHTYAHSSDEPFSKVISARVAQMRKKLKQIDAKDAIETQRGVGYRLSDKYEVVDDDHTMRLALPPNMIAGLHDAAFEGGLPVDEFVFKALEDVLKK